MLLGAPVSIRVERWRMATSSVAGRFINGYSRRDWVLGLVYRGSNGALTRRTQAVTREGLACCSDVASMQGAYCSTANCECFVCAGFIKGAGGISPVDCPGVENVNLSNLISGHFDYATKIDEIVDLLQL